LYFVTNGQVTATVDFC